MVLLLLVEQVNGVHGRMRNSPRHGGLSAVIEYRDVFIPSMNYPSGDADTRIHRMETSDGT